MASLDYVSGDATIKAISSDARSKGATRYPQGDQTVYEIYEKHADLDSAKYIVGGDHGDVLDLALFIEIQDENDLVPIGVIGATYEDEEGVTVNRTWMAWISSSCNIIERDNRKFVGTRYHNLKTPALSELIPVFGELLKTSDLPVEPPVVE